MQVKNQGTFSLVLVLIYSLGGVQVIFKALGRDKEETESVVVRVCVGTWNTNPSEF